MSEPVGSAERLRARVSDDRVGVRRIAVADLERASASDPGAAELILQIALGDSDEKARILAIRALARIGYEPAMADLLGLYTERSTPAAVAHAAILAHDTILGAGRNNQAGAARAGGAGV